MPVVSAKATYMGCFIDKVEDLVIDQKRDLKNKIGENMTPQACFDEAAYR
jgi:hypothetical protein